MEEKPRILVVDDERYITALLEKTLADAGYVVTVANDGNSALASLEAKEPDLVLLDIRMPGLDGYQVLQRIREVSSVPVLMVTALHDKSALSRSLDLGADDFIEKPFLPQVLVARVRAKLRRGG